MIELQPHFGPRFLLRRRSERGFFSKVSRSLNGLFFKSFSTFSAAVILFYPNHSYAQEHVSPTAKGVVGGALLGADLVTIGEAIIGVKPAWAYLVGAGVGAIGGGVGGFFVEDASSDGRAPLYLLAGGLALSIPAVVLTLNATRYVPAETPTDSPDNVAPDSKTNEKMDPSARRQNAGAGPTSEVNETKSLPSTAIPPTQGTGSDSNSSKNLKDKNENPGNRSAEPSSSLSPSPSSSSASSSWPQFLFNLHEGKLKMGLPIPEIKPIYTMRERLQYGVAQQTEFRVPVVGVHF